MKRLSFYSEINRNKRQSFIFLIVVFIILIILSYVIALVVGQGYFWIIIIIGTIISLIYVVAGYYKSAEIAIAGVKARKASKEQYKQYHDIVEGLCLASGMPKPGLYVMKGEQINAFASGRNPQNAVICVTEGALNKLDKRELEGVLAHELSHIASYDIRFMSLVAVLVGMVAIVSQIFLRSLWFRSFGGNRDQTRTVFLIIGIALAILAPIVVALVQLAISRRREYNADASAVKFIRSPTGLRKALEKIKHGNKKQPIKVSGALSPLFISKPSLSKEFFQTHPPIDRRIERLNRM